MDNKVEQQKENRDPITGAAGAHPVGAGIGAVAGGATGAAIGVAVGGPVGAVVGAAVGGIAGGLTGKGAAEMVNPTREDTYWRENYASRPYVQKGTAYDQFAPAYRYGWESRTANPGKSYADVENSLGMGWDKVKGTSTLGWNHAKAATRDAWHRVETAMPGDADHDGR